VAHATDTTGTEPTRRDFLMLTTGAFAAVGTGALLVPLIGQLAPDAQVVAAGAPIEDRRAAHQAGARAVADHDRQLHPSRLRAARPVGRL
jgi:Rieske Fe-S protein